MGMSTWRAEVARRMEATGERLADLMAVEPAGALDEAFDNGRHRPPAGGFLAWSERFVYFPIWVDGYPRVGSAPRDPF